MYFIARDADMFIFSTVISGLCLKRLLMFEFRQVGFLHQPRSLVGEIKTPDVIGRFLIAVIQRYLTLDEVTCSVG